MAIQTSEAVDERQRSLFHRLQDAVDSHAVIRRSTCEGASALALNADADRWIEIGGAIGALARLIQVRCAMSGFCSARPSAEMLATRICEAVDDQLDGPAWAMIAAAARLEVETAT